VDEARDYMRRRAWDAPPGHNFKDVTDAAVGRWPQNTALTDIRREAAELVVHDALARFDAYPLFNELGDAIVTGPTGNNLRDLRILLAG